MVSNIKKCIILAEGNLRHCFFYVRKHIANCTNKKSRIWFPLPGFKGKLLSLKIGSKSKTPHAPCDPPVVVGQLDIVSGHQNFAVLQPDEVRLRNTLGHAREHRTAPCWLGNGLWPLEKLRRSCGGKRAGMRLSCRFFFF